MTEKLTDALARMAGFVGELRRPYAIIGGVAINALVRVRGTTDIDAMVVLRPDEVDDVLPVARAHGYAFDLEEVRAFAEGGLLRMWGPPDREEGFGVDLLFGEDAFLEEVIARAITVELGGHPLRFATVEDLLLMKLDANRSEDLDDAIAIKDAFGGRLDRAYLDRQARALDIEARLRVLLDSGE